MLALVLVLNKKKVAMSPPSTVHGGQHDTKYVAFELLIHAAFVAHEFWGVMPEPARIYLVTRGSVLIRTGTRYLVATKRMRGPVICCLSSVFLP